MSGTEVKLSLSTMYAANKVVTSTKVNRLVVRGINDGPRIFLPNAFTRSIMPGNLNHISTSDIARMWPHLEKIADHIQHLRDCEIGLLIRYNCPRALAPREVVTSSKDGQYGLRTEVKTKDKEIFTGDVLKVLERDFGDFGVGDIKYSQKKKKNVPVLSQSIHFENDHYERPRPFRGKDQHLPNNRTYALNRLKPLKRRLGGDETFRKHYSQFTKELLKNNHAEIVPKSEMNQDRGAYGIYHTTVYIIPRSQIR